MPDDNNKQKRDTTLEEQFRDFVLELGKVLGKFTVEMTRLIGKGTMMAYRAIAQRRADEARDAKIAARNAEDSVERAEGIRGRRKNAPETQFVERTSHSDDEAASLLEDFLQETARGMQPQVVAQPIDVDQPPAVDTTSTEEKADVMDSLPETDVQDGFDDAAVEAPPITYNTEDERARIQEELRQREERLKQEQEQRKVVYDEEERKQREKQEQMQADLERIRREKREKEEAFRRAEEARKQRERERQERIAGAHGRLADDEPATDTESDEGDTQNQSTDSGR